MDASDPTLDRQRLEALTVELHHLGNIQVTAEHQYIQRTNMIITLEGLLAVAAGTLLSVGREGSVISPWRPVELCAALGLTISFTWYFLEQRNLLYFKSRERVIRALEMEVASLFQSVYNEPFPRFWSRVGELANRHTPWQQRVSAQMLQRTILPLSTAIVWLIILVQSIRIGS